jgi:hypothetical protein
VRTTASVLNSSCLCRTLDEAKIEAVLTQKLAGIPGDGVRRFFSHTAVYLSSQDVTAMTTAINVIEGTLAQPAFLRAIGLPVITEPQRGVFMGYDFHITDSGPKLIEINTNAGGAYLNLLLAEAQLKCCEGSRPPTDISGLEERFFTTFQREWELVRGNVSLKTIAIVDEDPASQFLYPEFLLFQRLFRQKGIDCEILDPSELELVDDHLSAHGKAIDLVYNRSTDFYLEGPTNVALRRAHELRSVVLTPSPQLHQRYAHKSNLVLLSSSEFLASIQVAEADQRFLKQVIPKTLLVSEQDSDKLWRERKRYFFKPLAGFGSKAAFRGDKVTKGVWENILQGEYVAQEIVAPEVRRLDLDGTPSDLKSDLRVYTYDGKPLLFAARLYSGQTTNFRTAGGGFAAVFMV